MEIDFRKVLIWVLLVLLAGFIGQFGKSLGIYLINRFKRRKTIRSSENEEKMVGLQEGEIKRGEKVITEAPSLLKDKVQKKLFKTRLKVIKKEAKKG
jgi:hypothetical protein